MSYYDIPVDARSTHTRELSDAEYARLLEFRTGLRRFQRWSERRALEHGVTAAQHQLMLAIRGRPREPGPTIGDVAESLLLQHHSAVGLVDRAVEAGLVARGTDRRDHRVVRLRLTSRGEARLRELTRAHLEELKRLAPHVRSLWADLDLSDD
jgi:DNA-binding MarR family transcriptional regulator